MTLTPGQIAKAIQRAFYEGHYYGRVSGDENRVMEDFSNSQAGILRKMLMEPEFCVGCVWLNKACPECRMYNRRLEPNLVRLIDCEEFKESA